jgi:hypothetical protein
MERLMTWDTLRLFQTANKIEALEQVKSLHTNLT